MKRHLQLSLLLLIAATLVGSAQIRTDESPLTVLRKAESAFQLRTYRESLREWTDATSARPDAAWTTVVQLRQAVVERELGRINLAAGDLDRVRSHHTDTEIEQEVWLQKGLTALAAEDHGWARYCFNKSIPPTPTDLDLRRANLAATAYYWIGISHITDPDNPQQQLAISALKTCVQAYPTADKADDALFALGQMLEATRHPDQALQQYARIRSDYPNGGFADAAAVRAAQCLIGLNRNREALELADSISLELSSRTTAVADPDSHERIIELHDEASLTAGNAALAMRQLPRAEQSFLNIAYRSGAPLRREATLGLADTYLAAGRADSALALYRRLHRERTDDRIGQIARIREGVALQQLKSTDGAVELLSTIGGDTTDAMRDEALLEVGRIRYIAGKYDEAIESLRQAIKATSRPRLRAEASTVLGLAYFANGDTKTAASVLDTTDATVRAMVANGLTQGDRAAEDLTLLTAISLVAADRPADAIPRINELLQMAPSYDRADEATYWLGEAYYRAGLLPSAIETMGALVETYPSSPRVQDALYTSGWAQFRMGACRGAEQTLAQLVKVFPFSSYVAEANLTRGDCCFLLHEYDQAVDRYNAVLAVDSTSDVAQHAAYQRGVAERNLERYPEAVNAFDRYISHYPNGPQVADALFQKAEVDLLRQSYPQAIEEYENLLARYDTSRLAAHSTLSLSQAYEQSGRPLAAYAAQTILLEEHPASTYCDEARAELARLRSQLCRPHSERTDIPRLLRPGGLAVERGDVFVNIHQYDHALTAYHAAIDSSDDESIGGGAVVGLLRASWMAGDIERTLDSAGPLLDRFPDSKVVARGLLTLSNDILAGGDTAHGQRLLALIREHYPSLDESWNAAIIAATIEATAGELDSARLLLLQQVSRSVDADTAARMSLALAELDVATGDYQAAHSRLDQLDCRTDDIGAEALYRLGRCYAAEGRFEEAASTFQQVIAHVIDDSRWHGRAQFALGESYEQLGQTDRARMVYTQLLRRRDASDVRLAAQQRLELMNDL